MTDQRLLLLKEWLQDILDGPFDIQVASSDASFRRYFRVIQANKSYIAMDAPPAHEDTSPFIHIAEKLRLAGVHAPAVYHKNIEQGFLLLSDLGSQDYLPQLDQQTANQYYHDALQALVKMQKIAATDLPTYGPTLLQAEMDLFDEWFLQKHLNIHLDARQKQALADTQAYLVSKALEQPKVFVHRDYHSRNLMLTTENNPGVIDFQDAVYGPITYDLVSLLRDCYISWPDDQVYQWVTDFYHMLSIDTDLATFKQWFDLMGLQRHIKVLGIFARLHHRDGKSAYLNDLPLTWRYTKMIASRYRELSDFNRLLEQLMIERRLSA